MLKYLHALYCLKVGVASPFVYKWNIYPPLEFHRWNSCKQNKQAANNRAATNNQMVTPEGEKLHSDSGISVDTQSLQEQQHQQAQAEVQALHPPHQDQIGQCARLFVISKWLLWKYVSFTC